MEKTNILEYTESALDIIDGRGLRHTICWNSGIWNGIQLIVWLGRDGTDGYRGCILFAGFSRATSTGIPKPSIRIGPWNWGLVRTIPLCEGAQPSPTACPTAARAAVIFRIEVLDGKPIINPRFNIMIYLKSPGWCPNPAVSALTLVSFWRSIREIRKQTFWTCGKSLRCGKSICGCRIFCWYFDLVLHLIHLFFSKMHEGISSVVFLWRT